MPFVYTQLPIISHQEEFTMNEKDGAIRDANVLGVPKMLILGLQHMFAMFGATILVPILVNSYFGEDVLHVQVTLICAGIGTLFFHLCSKFKVPAFLGSSFAFLGGFATIANMDSGVFADMSNADKLSYACGGIVVAGLLYLILALIIKLVGVKKVMRFLPPVVTGPIIICIGLSLAGSAINNASTNWLLALIALVTIIVFNIWGRGMFKIIPILMGVIISYIAALIFNAMGMSSSFRGGSSSVNRGSSTYTILRSEAAAPTGEAVRQRTEDLHPGPLATEQRFERQLRERRRRVRGGNGSGRSSYGR